MTEDIERMLFCVGTGVTVEGIRMGDVGFWRCAGHHPHLKPNYTREEWAEARAKGRLYPDSPDGEWRSLGEITSKLFPAAQAAE